MKSFTLAGATLRNVPRHTCDLTSSTSSFTWIGLYLSLLRRNLTCKLLLAAFSPDIEEQDDDFEERELDRLDPEATLVVL